LGVGVNLDGTISTKPQIDLNPYIYGNPNGQQRYGGGGGGGGGAAGILNGNGNTGNSSLIYFGGGGRKGNESVAGGPNGNARHGPGIAAAIYSDAEKNVAKKREIQKELGGLFTTFKMDKSDSCDF
jgi:hypothetical protein